jgi:acetylglutamate kinase
LKALIKIGGSLLDDPASRDDIARQIRELAASGVSVVVVHGGGKQVTRFLEERGIKSNFVRGLRVTTEETIDAVLKVLAGTVNTQLVAAIGAKAVGLTGIDAGLATAEQLDPELGFVGRVVESDPRVLDALVDDDFIPVVACVAGGSGGAASNVVFNVNGDSMAVAVASSWGADRLVFLTDVAGVLDANKKIIPELTLAGCQELIDSGVAAGGMQAKLNAASDAVANGVQEISIVKGSDASVVKRIFDGEEIGTRIIGRHNDPLLPIMTALIG